MSDPLINLLLFSAAAALALAFFRPRQGLYWRWRRLAGRSRRVLVEDALKQLYHCAYRGSRATVHSLAGVLSVSPNHSARLLADMRAMGLTLGRGEEFELTAAGRTQALHLIRAHRLWERYLAEHTSVSDLDWHRNAELKEHSVSPQEADALAARLNFPVYDPHGDPIPTVGGEIAPFQGLPMTDLDPGQPARIVHLEDEPEALYRQITALGLAPGMQVEVIEAQAARVRFRAQGQELSLAPVAAANIWTTPRAEETGEAPDSSAETLASLAPGERGRVVAIAGRCRGRRRHRLLDLGVVPGTLIQAEFASPLGDPISFNIRGASIALRCEQAELILIQREPGAEEAS